MGSSIVKPDMAETNRPLKIQTTKGKNLELGKKIQTKIPHKTALEISTGTTKLESWHKSDKELVKLVAGSHVVNQFIATVHTSFSEHYPLLLTPDVFWICITQGFATHVNQNAERLRNNFVTHEGKKEIEIIRDNFSKGNPDNDWPDVFSDFSTAIRTYIGDSIHKTIVSSFSTTGPLEKAISELVLMDSMQKYFNYSVATRCGIPSFYIGGTKSDWELMRVKAQALVALDKDDLESWGSALDGVLSEIVNSFDSGVNNDFWDSFYKYRSESGGSRVSGWVNILFPYLSGHSGVVERNSNANLSWESQQRAHSSTKPNEFPLGMSKVPFIWKYLGIEFKMEFVGGIVGASQCGEEGILQPEFGWAVLDR